MPFMGLAGERLQTYALDHAVTGTGSQHVMKLTYPFDRRSGGPQSGSEGFGDKKIFFLLRGKEPQIPFLIHCTRQTEWDRHRRLKSITFPSPVLILYSSTDEKGGGADGSQLQCRECGGTRLLVILNVVS